MDEHGPDAPPDDSYKLSPGYIQRHKNERKYLPTLADLIDRLSIVQLKEIYIGVEYAEERKLIEHDISLLVTAKANGLTEVSPAELARAFMLIMLANHTIWLNESKARQGGSEQDKLLKFTHSINGVRNRAKNVIAKCFGERVDLKTDCLAADLDPSFGNWDVFK